VVALKKLIATEEERPPIIPPIIPEPLGTDENTIKQRIIDLLNN